MSGTTEVRLGDLAAFIRGITFKPDDVVSPATPGAVPCMRTKNVQAELDQSDIWAVPRALVKRPAQFLKPGDCLVSSANSWNLVGKCCWVPPAAAEEATFGGFVSVLRADPSRVDPRFLYRWFSAPHVQHVVRTFGRRTTSISNLDLDRCRNLPVPLPPLDEQRRIARVLDKADGLRAKREATIAYLEKLQGSVFRKMFGWSRQAPVTIGDRLERHPDGWDWEPLSDVARLATGHTPDRKRPNYWGGEIPWVTLTDIRRLDGQVTLDTTEHITDAGIQRSSAVRLPAGTVCLSRTASVGFVTVAGRELATSQDFVNWVCGPRLDPIYLMHALLRSRERLRALSAGSTHKTIYFPTVERLRALVPPLELQTAFRERVSALATVESSWREQGSYLDALFASLQSRAFKGEL